MWRRPCGIYNRPLPPAMQYIHATHDRSDGRRDAGHLLLGDLLSANSAHGSLCDNTAAGSSTDTATAVAKPADVENRIFYDRPGGGGGILEASKGKCSIRQRSGERE